MKKLNKKASTTYGSDPELMIRNRATGKIVSSIPILKCDKNNPVHLANGVNVYADNVLVEASFPPVTTKEEFVGQFREAFKGIAAHLGEDFELVPQASHVYDDNQLNDEAAWAIGCSPNYDAYKIAVNPTAEFANGLRTGSAHIHLGNKKLTDFDTRHKAIRLLDIFVGCSSILFDKDETSRARRKYYGTAGEFRPTKYGLEYRVLSPYVLRSPELVALVFDLVNYTLAFIANNEADEILELVDEDEVKTAINTCNRTMAEKILTDVDFPKQMLERVKQEYNTNFYEAWGLK